MLVLVCEICNIVHFFITLMMMPDMMAFLQLTGSGLKVAKINRDQSAL